MKGIGDVLVFRAGNTRAPGYIYGHYVRKRGSERWLRETHERARSSNWNQVLAAAAP